ncbi:P-loop containing nucleoside triphosphate hydrolases superfamily protein [Artemisia annua]|uniref:P-loop containing nucleoside triphosphate hydrolases superfamily protein n=1 Tax=Artemisia annua TaxID=35608 RepID=A0A2U1NH33_ARTAN|nr:P-loop containing nucleoside triphosphate hydrolases superfamily protein [Artemisia annua]
MLHLNDLENKVNESQRHIRTLRRNQTHKVTAFGELVPNLLQVIERNHRRFRKPPIGPIGSHLALTHGDKWAVAVEHAIGKLFNSFIVTDHKDFLLLRSCAREANYHNLNIIIFDFSIPRFQIESQKLPHTNHPTTLSVIQSDSPTVLNVLVDQGHAERQVLVRDYEMGKAVAFDQRIQNLLEVYTLEGHRMFTRRSAQTTLPPNRKLRTRLCGSYDDQIKIYERETLQFQEQAQEIRGKKRSYEEQVQSLNDELKKAKKQCVAVEKQAMSKNLKLKDLKNSRAAEAVASSESNVDDIQHEISKLRTDINESEILREKIQEKFNEAEAKLNEYKAMFAELCELAKGDFNALEKATHELTQIEEDLSSADAVIPLFCLSHTSSTHELTQIEEDLSSADAEKRHYEKAMQERFHMRIESAKERLHGSENERKVKYDKASIICPESEIQALGGCGDTTSEQLQAHFKRLKVRHQQESQRHQESIDELRIIYEKKERKILKQQQTYKAFKEKLSAINTALEKRWSKFERNASLLKRLLTIQFNGHLRKKGVSGSIKVKMPQDASSSNVRDTRGLSGGERSFSTLCFALALHEMTEAPFRAMDEFDVFMDAVSRKISLETIVDFALVQGSQWIFITPHDISMVKDDERIKKQQMAAPRS